MTKLALYQFIEKTVSILPENLKNYLINFEKELFCKRDKASTLSWCRQCVTDLFNFYQIYGRNDLTLNTHICLALARLYDCISPYLLYTSDCYPEFVKLFMVIDGIAKDRAEKYNHCTDTNYLDGYSNEYKTLYYITI